jgi:predicted RNA binding protein YcfA (HicA-like mRNA interferase family)
MDMSSAPALPRNGRVIADYEQRGYERARETGVGVVLRHPNGGMITVLANGEIRGGDKAGPALNAPDDWWGEPTYTAPE